MMVECAVGTWWCGSIIALIERWRLELVLLEHGGMTSIERLSLSIRPSKLFQPP